MLGCRASVWFWNNPGGCRSWGTVEGLPSQQAGLKSATELEGACLRGHRVQLHDQNPFILQGPGEIKRREVVLVPQASPEEIMSREVELGCESWSFFASSCYSTTAQRTLSL